MTKELLPCPFCGGEAKIWHGETFCDDDWGVECVNNACPIQPGTETYGTEEEAIDAWNRRAERTCHDFGGEEDTNGEGYDFACSACGFCCDQPEPNYCPNCGAKVVD